MFCYTSYYNRKNFGFSDEWEPEDNDDTPELMPGYEDAPKKESEVTLPKAPSDALDESLASRKRGRRDKKKKIEVN